MRSPNSMRPAILISILLSLSVTHVFSTSCPLVGVAFPVPPHLSSSTPVIEELSRTLDASLKAFTEGTLEGFNTSLTSYSIQITSSKETLWQQHHTAKSLDPRSTQDVGGDSVFRIASITKVFTVLSALLQEQPGMSLDDPITKHVPRLKRKSGQDSDGGGIEWDKITLRQLGSHLGGLPRDFGQLDLVGDIPNPEDFGLPALNDTEIPHCFVAKDNIPCTRKQYIDELMSKPPLFSPGDKSSYSNIGFTLLAAAIESFKKKPFADVVEADILQPLQMNNTSFKKPEHGGVIPATKNEWDLEIGFNGGEGGLYSTTNDLTKFIRALLSNTIPNLSQDKLNMWLKPTSFTGALRSHYGTPWEIRRYDGIASDTHIVDGYTKNGGLSGYYSTVMIFPELGVGITILVASDNQQSLNYLQTIVPEILIKRLCKYSRGYAEKVYSGRYSSATTNSGKINSSLELSVDKDSPGLHITNWISNGKEVIPLFFQDFGNGFSNEKNIDDIDLRIYPAGSGRSSTDNNIDAWRLSFSFGSKSHHPMPKMCFGDWDSLTYGGRAVGEFLFRWDEERTRVVAVELPAFRSVLFLESEAVGSGSSRGFRVQGVGH